MSFYQHVLNMPRRNYFFGILGGLVAIWVQHQIPAEVSMSWTAAAMAGAGIITSLLCAGTFQILSVVAHLLRDHYELRR